MVSEALTVGKLVVDVAEGAQQAWVEQLPGGPAQWLGAPDCTPGSYNNQGQEPTPALRSAVGFPAGPSAYFRYLDGWRSAVPSPG